MRQHNIPKLLTLSTSLLVAMIAPGCATVKTTNMDRAKPGLAYFLPKQMTKVTVKRTAADIQKAIKALTAADGALAKAKAAHSAAESAVKLTEAILKDDRIPETQKAKYRLNLVKEEQAVTAAKADLDSKQLKLDAAKTALESLIPGAPTPTGTNLEKATLVLREAKSTFALTEAILNDKRIPDSDKLPYRYKSHSQKITLNEAQRVFDTEQAKFDAAEALSLKVKRANTELQEAKDNHEKVLKAFEAQKKVRDEAQAEVNQTKLLLQADLSSAQQEEFTERLSEQKASLEAAQLELIRLNTAKDNAGDLKAEKREELDSISVAMPAANPNNKAKAKKYILDVKLELQAPTADTEYGYHLNPKHNWMRDDTHKVTVTPAGLLSTVNIVAADRTADIVTELAIFAGALSGSVIPGSGEMADQENSAGEKKCADTPGEIILMVDFADSESIGNLNKDLECFGMKVDEISDPGTWGDNVPRTKFDKFEKFVGNVLTKDDKGINETSRGGLLYRTPVDVVLKISQCSKVPCTGDADWVTTKMVSQNLPQAGPISYVRQHAGLMTKTTYDVGFKDGVLTSYDSNRPSEVLEVAKAPMKIIDGLADGVSKMISIQIGKNKKLAELSESELELLQAQLGIQSGQNTALAEISTTELALLQAQLGLQSGENTALVEISESELALLQARLGLQTGENNALASLSESELALLQAQMGLHTGANDNLKNLYASQLSLLQAQLELERGRVTGGTALSESELESLRARAALSNAENDINAQAVANQLAALIAITRDQARIDLIETCLKDQVASGESTDICLEVP